MSKKKKNEKRVLNPLGGILCIFEYEDSPFFFSFPIDDYDRLKGIEVFPDGIFKAMFFERIGYKTITRTVKGQRLLAFKVVSGNPVVNIKNELELDGSVKLRFLGANDFGILVRYIPNLGKANLGLFLKSMKDDLTFQDLKCVVNFENCNLSLVDSLKWGSSLMCEKTRIEEIRKADLRLLSLRDCSLNVYRIVL